jgi:hypothetical protein
MSVRAGSPTAGEQLRPLVETFLARFFENEVTAGRTDLRHSFFWIIAVLAGPGLLGIVYRQFAWAEFAMRRGSEALSAYVLFDKALYLAVTFVAIGFVSAVAWPSLTIDRRDGLILGALPIRLRSIVLAKLAALGAYILILSVGMHSLTALLVGGALHAGTSLDAVVRGIAAHLISATALAVFVFAASAGAQATSLALLGPKLFGRVSALLQVLLVGLTTAALIALPTISGAAPGTLARFGRFRADWILYTPPIWFLGLYETLSGSTLPVMHTLARIAGLSLALTLLVVALAYPIACRRVLLATVQGSPPLSRPWLRRLMGRLPEMLTQALPTRAAIQFALATFSRVSRQRLVMSAGIGLGLAAITPIALAWIARPSGPPTTRMTIAVAAAPLFLIVCLVTAMRIAASAPAELSARWVFAVAPAPWLAGRDALRRITFGLGVLPIVALSTTFWWTSFGPARAIEHAAVTTMAGLILVEIQSWGIPWIPCTRPLDPGAVNLHARWPAYVLGLIVFCGELPHAEVTLARTPFGLLVMLLLMAGLWLAVKRGSIAAAKLAVVWDERDPLLLLNLSAPPPQRKTSGLLLGGSGEKGPRGPGD